MTSFARTFQRISLTTTVGLTLFNVATAIMLGIAGDVIDLIASEPMLPALVSFVALTFIFASSNTRNPDRYHPVEWLLVLGSIVMMLAFTFVTEFGSFVQSTEPVSVVALFVLFGATSAIVAR